MTACLRLSVCGVVLAFASCLAAAQRPEKPGFAPAAAASRPAPTDAGSLVKEADAASKSWKSLTCKAAYTYRILGKEGGGEAELALVAEAELSLVAEGVDRRRKARLRADGTLAAPDGRRFSGVVEDLSRAASVFTVVDVAGRTFECRARREPGEPVERLAAGPRVFDLTSMLASPAFLRVGASASKNDKVELRLRGTETVGGVLCDALEITVSSVFTMKINGVPKERRTQRSDRLAIGRQDRFVRSVYRNLGGGATDAESGQMQSLVLTDVRVDVPIAPEKFTLDVAGLSESPFGGPRSR